MTPGADGVLAAVVRCPKHRLGGQPVEVTVDKQRGRPRFGGGQFAKDRRAPACQGPLLHLRPPALQQSLERFGLALDLSGHVDVVGQVQKGRQVPRLVQSRVPP